MRSVERLEGNAWREIGRVHVAGDVAPYLAALRLAHDPGIYRVTGGGIKPRYYRLAGLTPQEITSAEIGFAAVSV